MREGASPLWLLALAVIPAVALASVVKDVGHSHWTDEYDPLFRKYTKHYFGPHVDWRWFKAQGIAESGLNADAQSPAGAVGIMQILPSTYAEIKESNPHFVNIRQPRWNIAAAIYYDRMLYRKWQEGFPANERLKLAFASYNAGLGNVLRAFRRARERQREGEVRLWSEVAPYAPTETRAYVVRIQRLMIPQG
ncbi:MAG: transglycosylase SLT domain-containing protein [Chromatiales bacterium]|jgi:membrane-bound lytic murein transglycosylase F